MPTYEYECKTCSHKFEVFQRISEEPVKSCPECGKEVRRLIGGGLGIIFKGSGFYVTDNRSGSGGPGGAKKSEGDSSEKKDTSKSSDSSSSSSSGETGKSKEPASKK